MDSSSGFQSEGGVVVYVRIWRPKPDVRFVVDFPQDPSATKMLRRRGGPTCESSATFSGMRRSTFVIQLVRVIKNKNGAEVILLKRRYEAIVRRKVVTTLFGLDILPIEVCTNPTNTGGCQKLHLPRLRVSEVNVDTNGVGNRSRRDWNSRVDGD